MQLEKFLYSGLITAVLTLIACIGLAVLAKVMKKRGSHKTLDELLLASKPAAARKIFLILFAALICTAVVIFLIVRPTIRW